MEQPNSAIGTVVRPSPHKLEMTLVTSVCSLTALMVIAVAAMLFVSTQQRTQVSQPIYCQEVE